MKDERFQFMQLPGTRTCNLCGDKIRKGSYALTYNNGKVYNTCTGNVCCDCIEGLHIKIKALKKRSVGMWA
jgi:hypothetical protein